MRRIKIKHSKGSHEYIHELRLRELLEEKEEFVLSYQEEKNIKMHAILSREEMIALKEIIEETLEYTKSKDKDQLKESLPTLKKEPQKEFMKDYLQQKDSSSLEEQEHSYDPSFEKRKDR